MKCKECNGVGKWDYGPGLHEIETCKSCNGSGVMVRAEVSWFAQQMEQTLRHNDHKGGWGDCTGLWLYERLLEETNELGCVGLGNYEKIIREATDVANFAMMIADRAKKKKK